MSCRRSLCSVALLAALALAASCGGGDGPTDPRAALVGTWTLEAADGAPLPRVEFATGPGYAVSVTAGRLVFAAADGRGRGEYTRHYTPAAPSPGPAPYDETTAETFAYELAGARLILHYDSEGARAGVPDTATLAGDVLTVPRHFEVRYPVYRFRKQP